MYRIIFPMQIKNICMGKLKLAVIFSFAIPELYGPGHQEATLTPLNKS